MSASVSAASTAPMARRPGRRSATSIARTAAPRSPVSIARARAALVTPLRDGMNLVAKEYVAAQDPDDPGVLILSRFAGAAVECKPALLVNPYDPESGRRRDPSRADHAARRAPRAAQPRSTTSLPRTTSTTGPDRFLSALTGTPTLDAPPGKRRCPRRRCDGARRTPRRHAQTDLKARRESMNSDRKDAMGHPGRLYPVGQRFAGSRAALARDRLHPQRRRPRRQYRADRILRQPRTGRVSRHGAGASHLASALQRPERSRTGAARHRLCVGVRIRRTDRGAAYAARFAPRGDRLLSTIAYGQD